MNKETNHRIRLGIFVSTGIVLLIVALYFIGNNRNMFGRTFMLYATFQNVHGLQTGNNVRFSGIDVGTVEDIVIINDTSVQVEMVIDEALKNHIRKNSVASIGTDGLMGNKLVNIEPGSADAPFAMEGDDIPSLVAVNTEDMLRTLELTNQNIAFVSADLKKITGSVQKNKGTLFKVLMDTAIGEGMGNTLKHIEEVSENLANVSKELSSMMQGIKSGKGTIGMLLQDTVMPNSLEQTVRNVNNSSKLIVEMSEKMNDIVQRIDKDNGTLNALISDTATANSLKQTMINIQTGTDNFNQNMEALKHSFLLRGYFQDIEKQKRKEQKKK